MKELELYDGCTIKVNTDAQSVEEFLSTVPIRNDDLEGKQFFYKDSWYPAFDLDFIFA